MAWPASPMTPISPNSLPVDVDDIDCLEAPLPSPSNTPYRTPQLSRQPSYTHDAPSPYPPASPQLSNGPIFHSHHQHAHQHNRVSLLTHDPAMDETISILDPRRFTPTLHANLVAEILSLRRELESKAQLIDSLETDLSTARTEQELASTTIATAQREARDVKRQLTKAENDTLVDTLVKERDQAADTIGELRRQVERLTRSRRLAEEEAERTRRVTDRDAERWEEVRRGLERRAHVAEGRLKAVLEEVAAQNMPQDDPASHSETETTTDASSIHGIGSDTASVRTISRTDNRQSFMVGDDVAERFGVRFSHLGISLAEELDLPEDEDEEDSEDEDDIDDDHEDDDEDYMSDEPEGTLTPMQMEMPITVDISTQTSDEFQITTVTIVDPQHLEALAEKEVELSTLIGRYSELETKYNMKNAEILESQNILQEEIQSWTEKNKSLEEKELMLEETEKKIAEEAVKLEQKAQDINLKLEAMKEEETKVRANRTESTPLLAKLPPPIIYISTAAQTLESEAPPPPPKRIRSPPPVLDLPPPPPPKDVSLQTTGTQTDPLPPAAPTRAPPPPPLARIIPTIQVIPPPPTPPLPPQPKILKTTASQTVVGQGYRSTSMQTEQIINRPPPTLLPSTVLATNVPIALPDTGPAPSVPRRSSKRIARKPPAPASQTNPVASVAEAEEPADVVIDNEASATPPPISKGKQRADIRTLDSRPPRISSLYPAPSIDIPGSTDDDDSHHELDISDPEYNTVLSAPKPRKQRQSRNFTLDRPAAKPTPNIRRSVLITSGTQAHARARSPSLNTNGTGSGGVGPPFPVPARFSSKKSAYSGSERTNSPTPAPSGNQRGIARNNKRQPSLRKSRSAAALSSVHAMQRDRSPPPLSTSTAAPDSPPLLPPLPRDEVLSPSFDRRGFASSHHKSQASTNTSNTGNTSVESAIQQTSVVDAIAQTMVGEWMWKYVRRRRSFGVPDSPNGFDGRDETAAGGGQRHKRWVWLAPYERAVMWSSRQPTSGNALLGKSGRKLAIQSVLDVKDDTPFPRGTNQQPIFNRSILILTPARALKFTAPTRERHYVWLTALSFLSHSAQSADGLLALPPPMPFEFEQVQQQQAYQTNNRMLSSTEAPNYSSIRDSIRIAKGRSKPEPNGFRQNANALMHKNSIREVSSIISNDSVAEPPSIPRFPGHSRKRSNTGSRPPNPRSFSNGISANSSYRGSIHGDSMYYGNGVVGGVGIISGNSSIAHGSAGGGWDAPVGTVRMEAFVERKSRSEYDEDEYQVPSSYRLRKERSRRDNNYWGPPANVDFYTGMEDDDFFRSDDPFRGF